MQTRFFGHALEAKKKPRNFTQSTLIRDKTLNRFADTPFTPACENVQSQKSAVVMKKAFIFKWPNNQLKA